MNASDISNRLKKSSIVFGDEAEFNDSNKARIVPKVVSLGITKYVLENPSYQKTVDTDPNESDQMKKTKVVAKENMKESMYKQYKELEDKRLIAKDLEDKHPFEYDVKVRVDRERLSKTPLDNIMRPNPFVKHEKKPDEIKSTDKSKKFAYAAQLDEDLKKKEQIMIDAENDLYGEKDRKTFAHVHTEVDIDPSSFKYSDDRVDKIKNYEHARACLEYNKKNEVEKFGTEKITLHSDRHRKAHPNVIERRIDNNNATFIIGNDNKLSNAEKHYRASQFRNELDNDMMKNGSPRSSYQKTRNKGEIYIETGQTGLPGFSG